MGEIWDRPGPQYNLSPVLVQSMIDATGVAAGAVTAVNSATENELVTVGSTTTELDAEANLTFDGTVVSLTGTMKIKEQAAAESDTAAYGQLWVKSDTPTSLYFTTDAGDDIQLTSGTDPSSTANLELIFAASNTAVPSVAGNTFVDVTLTTNVFGTAVDITGKDGSTHKGFICTEVGQYRVECHTSADTASTTTAVNSYIHKNRTITGKIGSQSQGAAAAILTQIMTLAVDDELGLVHYHATAGSKDLLYAGMEVYKVV